MILSDQVKEVVLRGAAEPAVLPASGLKWLQQRGASIAISLAPGNSNNAERALP